MQDDVVRRLHLNIYGTEIHIDERLEKHLFLNMVKYSQRFSG